MSGFIRGTAGIATAWLTPTSNNIRAPAWQWGPTGRNNGQLAPWADAVLWPSSRWAGGANALTMGNDAESAKWGPWPEEGGTQSMLKFVGLTLDDATGNPIAGATVHLYLDSPDTFLRDVVADAGGWFELCSEFAAQNHYLVAYKTGSPDSTGATLNTLQPS